MKFNHVETVGHIFVGKEFVQSLFQKIFRGIFVVKHAARVFTKERDVAERYRDFIGDDVNFAVLIRAINDAVKKNHFAVEPVKSSDAGVAKSFQVLDGDRAVETAHCQRLEQCDLINRLAVIDGLGVRRIAQQNYCRERCDKKFFHVQASNRFFFVLLSFTGERIASTLIQFLIAHC